MTFLGPAAFFKSISHCARIAQARAERVHERWFLIAGLRVRFRLAGDNLVAPLTRALAHLETAPSGKPADLCLFAWDCAALGLPYPAAPVEKDAFMPRGEVTSLSDERFHCAFAQQGRLLSVMDSEEGEAFYCVAAAAEIPRFEAAEPVRPILSWLLRAHGRQVIHAGAVGRSDGGILLLGRSGAGKSNTSMACLSVDLSYASDDFCAFGLTPEPVAYSLYSTGKTRAEDWRRHPAFATLAPDLDPTGREKVIYYLHQAAPQKLIPQFPIRAVVVVRRGGPSCMARPMSPAAALALAAPDTAKLIPGAGGEVLRNLAALVRAAPCFELSLGPDPALVAPTISALVTQLNQQALAA